MLTFTLLLLALSSLHAAPLRDDVVAPPRGRLQDRKVLVLPRSVPVEERRQGTEPSRRFIMDLNTGLVKEHINEMDRRVGPDDRLVSAKAETHSEKECVGEVIDGHCYQFNPTLMTFSEAESSCSVLSPRGHLASVTNGDLHSRLVSMVTKATKTPVLTWLGGVVKDKQSEWTDGSAWGYSDWMPGHPDTQTDKQACLEMFRIGETHTF
uniref:C-type lectin domain-containing protein n=1 Tax=Hucho hucho TaxID=62062 RepID=A0A4W5KE13_9TELE